MKRPALWLPLALFVIFFAVVMFGLIRPADRTVPSKLIGKPMPEFTLPPGHDEQAGLTSANLRSGSPRLVNVFASWCVPCVREAPFLLRMKQMGVPIDAIAIRDRPEDIAQFLDRYGNPYDRIGSDVDAKVQISLGSAGVPETFVVDGGGIIRHQHIGEIREEDVTTILEKLAAAS